MCTTMRPAAGDLCSTQSSWTWSPAPWTAFELAPAVRSFARITLFLVSLVLATTGLKVTTLRVLSLLILSSILFAGRLRTVTAYKEFHIDSEPLGIKFVATIYFSITRTSITPAIIVNIISSHGICDNLCPQLTL